MKSSSQELTFEIFFFLKTELGWINKSPSRRELKTNSLILRAKLWLININKVHESFKKRLKIKFMQMVNRLREVHDHCLKYLAFLLSGTYETFYNNSNKRQTLFVYSNASNRETAHSQNNHVGGSWRLVLSSLRHNFIIQCYSSVMS